MNDVDLRKQDVDGGKKGMKNGAEVFTANGWQPDEPDSLIVLLFIRYIVGPVVDDDLMPPLNQSNAEFLNGCFKASKAGRDTLNTDRR